MAKREFCERIVVTEKKREGRLSDSLPEYNFSGEYFIEEKLYNGKHWFSRKQSISDGNPAKGLGLKILKSSHSLSLFRSNDIETSFLLSLFIQVVFIITKEFGSSL